MADPARELQYYRELAEYWARIYAVLSVVMYPFTLVIWLVAALLALIDNLWGWSTGWLLWPLERVKRKLDAAADRYEVERELYNELVSEVRRDRS